MGGRLGAKCLVWEGLPNEMYGINASKLLILVCDMRTGVSHVKGGCVNFQESCAI